jgi:hypothetical protein
MSRWLFGIVVATLGIALSSTPAAAQFSSSVQGIVADQSGAVVPGVTVTARNLETQVAVSAVTNETGVYRLSSLAPGRYELLAEIAGFQPSRTEVRLETAQAAGVNLTLSVGGASEQVSVMGTSSEVFNPAETRVQTTIRTETLQELPLQGRNFLGLVALGSGITGHGAVGDGNTPADAPDNFSTEKTVEASGNGRNQSGNQFTLDGLNVTSNILQGTANLSPNPDSVQEVAIQTNTFSVENGRGSSVQVAITTKSGTNDYHGTGSYFFTNEQLRARTPFTTKYEPFSRHDMSATIGGPIWKNRTFFFGSVQPLRSRISQATSVITFETPEFVDYARRNYPNTIGTSLLNDYPLENVETTGVARTAADIFGGACGTAAAGNIPCNLPMVAEGRFKPSPFRNAIQYSGRVDHYLRDNNDRLYFNFYKVDLDTEQIGRRRGFYGVDNNNTSAYQASWLHIFSPGVLNEFSYGQIRVQGSAGDSPGIPFRVPEIGITNQDTGINAGWGPATFIQHNYNWRDVVTWVRGAHSLKIGGEAWMGDDDAQFRAPYERPSFQFNNLLDLVRDQPYQQSGVNYDPITGQVANGAYRHLLNTVGAFVQDDWKVRSNLTLTLGLRWDDYGNPYPDEDTTTMGNIFLGSGGTIDEQFANASVRQVDAVYENRLIKNFSPRAGVAWAPGNGDTWLIRGGTGLYHNWIPLGEANRVRQNPPGLVTPTFRVGESIEPILSIGTSDRPPYGFNYPVIPAGSLDERGGIVGARPGAGGIDRDIEADSTLIYNAGVERRLPHQIVAGITYTGSYTWNGLFGSDFNRYSGDLLDGRLDRLNPSFGQMYYELNANKIYYNGITFSARQVIGRSSFLANYTFSKVEDYGQAGTRVNRDPGFATPTAHNLSQYRAPADWDVRHRLAFAESYMLPEPSGSGAMKYILGGWQITGTGILQSGTPFTVFTDAPFAPVLGSNGAVVGLRPNSGDYNADGVNFDFPNAPTNVPDSFDRQDYINGVFQASSFPQPAPGQEGTLGRSTFRNPGFINIDMSLIKNNRITEHVNAQFRFEVFNVLNRVNLQGVNGNLASSTFGRSTSTYDPRIIQLGARVTF